MRFPLIFSKVLLAGIFSIWTLSGHGQEKEQNKLPAFIDRFVPDSVPPGKPRFLAYPTLAFSPETSWEIGISSVYLFHAKGDYVNNRLNEATAFLFYTLNNQYGLWLDHAIYTDQDKWFFLGRERIQEFPLYYFGYGRDAAKTGYSIADARYLLIRERALRKIYPDLFAGLAFDLQSLSRVSFSQVDPDLPALPLPRGGTGNTTLGLGASVIYDTRENYLNVREGWFAELTYLNYSRALASDFSFQSVLLDFRRYIRPFSPNQTLALQVLGQWTPGDAPFNQVALVGGESMMRGYYTGRFRDHAYLAAQAEYRFLPFPFSKRWGATAFLAGGVIGANPGNMFQNQPLISGGGGIRFLIFPKKDIFTRLDLGVTPEGTGFYIYLGEAF